MSVKLLRQMCDLYSQREVGKKIGKSAATVNLLLKGKYPNPHKILEKVSEVFAELNKNEVDCPVLNTIHLNVCLKYQEMARQNKFHKDRLYMQVKDHCKECKYKGVNNG